MNLLIKIEELARELIILHKVHMRHYTFICRKNNILSVGFNQKGKTHPSAPSLFKRIHSEFAAISKIKDKDILRRCKLINIRINRHGDILFSRPCETCQGLITSFDIPVVIYSDFINKLIWRSL